MNKVFDRLLERVLRTEKRKQKTEVSKDKSSQESRVTYIDDDA